MKLYKYIFHKDNYIIIIKVIRIKLVEIYKNKIKIENRLFTRQVN